MNKKLYSLFLSLLTFAIFIGVVPSFPQGGDSAEFCTTNFTLGIPHPTGYPMYTLVGYLFTHISPSSPSYSSNLLSLVYLSIGVFFVSLLVLQGNETNNTEPKSETVIVCFKVLTFTAFLISFLTASFTMYYATRAEVYTGSFALIACALFFWTRHTNSHKLKHLALFTLIFSLAIGFHMTNALLLPFILLHGLIAKDIGIKKALAVAAISGALILIEYSFLLILAYTNPTYNHPQARFWSTNSWTGSSSALENWLWFIRGGRWQRDGPVTSLSQVSHKLTQLLNSFKEITPVLLPTLIAFTVITLIRKLYGRRTDLFFGILTIPHALYFLLISFSGPAMVLILYINVFYFIVNNALFAAQDALLSLRKDYGWGIHDFLVKKPSIVKTSNILAIIIVSAAAALSLWNTRADFETRKRQFDDGKYMILEEINVLVPEHSVVERVKWDFSRIMVYKEMVERENYNFRRGKCNATRIENGLCFAIATKKEYNQMKKSDRLYRYAAVKKWNGILLLAKRPLADSDVSK